VTVQKCADADTHWLIWLFADKFSMSDETPKGSLA